MNKIAIRWVKCYFFFMGAYPNIERQFIRGVVTYFEHLLLRFDGFWLLDFYRIWCWLDVLSRKFFVEICLFIEIDFYRVRHWIDVFNRNLFCWHWSIWKYDDRYEPILKSIYHYHFFLWDKYHSFGLQDHSLTVIGLLFSILQAYK